MPIERIFLDWSRPCLHSVVNYLYERYVASASWDLSRAVVVTPGTHAGRRLIELLAQRTAQESEAGTPLLLTPPRVITVGDLPEALYESALPIASSMEILLARLNALRQNTQSVAALLPYIPAMESLTAWLRIADAFTTLQDELEGEGITCDKIGKISTEQFDVDDHARWEAIAALDQVTNHLLHEANLHTKHEARCKALDSPLREGRDIILIATVDLPQITRRLLDESNASITALVWASEEAIDLFDKYGGLITERWQNRTIPLAGRIDFLDRPIDQAASIAAQAGAMSNAPEEALTVALGEDALGPTVQRQLEMRGIKARRAAGRVAATTSPALLLRALGDYVSGRSVQSLMALLRQPVLIDALRKSEGELAENWISSLDTLAASYLPSSLDCDWSGIAEASARRAEDDQLPSRERTQADIQAADARRVQKTVQACDRLIAKLRGRRQTLPQWSATLQEILTAIYQGRVYDAGESNEAATIQALQALTACLESQRDLSDASSLSVPMSASDAIVLTLKQLASIPIPEPEEDLVVEIVGWLDAPLDDAPVLIVAGVNEGSLPESVQGDVLLPNRMRAALGLIDNARRYARDAYLLTAASHARGANLRLISGRISTEGDPLRPSRLLFACDEETMAKRALEFYEDKRANAAPAYTMPHGSAYTLATIPKPRPLKEPIRKVSVTAFASYLTCPYRFYLERVVRLNAPSEDCDEMDGGIFGSLAHEALRQFALSHLKDSIEPNAIASFLKTTLEDVVRDQFGDKLLPAVEIQARQLARRFAAFAGKQAEMAAEGWKIQHCERELQIDILVDSAPITISGKVDRIDYNEVLHKYRVLDYKTSDSGKSPEASHRVKQDGEKVWINLQLPLYRRLVAPLGIDQADIELGYFLLPKDIKNVAFDPATWSAEELAEADSIAEAVLRSIRAEKFWPPSSTVPPYGDGLETICMDASPDRQAIIGSSQTIMRHWKPEQREAAQ